MGGPYEYQEFYDALDDAEVGFCHGTTILSHIEHYDVLNYYVDLLPCRAMVRLQPSKHSRLQAFDQLLLREANDDIWTGSIQEIEPHLEITWATTVGGIHLPTTFKYWANSQERGFCWNKECPVRILLAAVVDKCQKTRTELLHSLGLPQEADTPFDDPLDWLAQRVHGFEFDR